MTLRKDFHAGIPDRPVPGNIDDDVEAELVLDHVVSEDGRFDNMFIQGDNLHAMRALIEEGYAGKFDLVYIDPPFWTGDEYFTKEPVKGESLGDDAEQLAYRDTWGGNLELYLQNLRARLELMARLLSDTGSIFVHVDWHAGHYVKVLLDEIFGMKNLRNEIIWHYGGPSPVKTSFPRKHDTIFYYVKSDNFTFHPQYNPLREYLRKRARKDPDGRLWVDQNVGKISEKRFNELKAEGRVFKTKTGRYRRKQYLDEMKGDMVDDVWEIPIINSQAKERLGYPTQKPEALLERVISCASNEGDLVGDFFCGSGTSLVVAHRLKRRWVGVDDSPVSARVCLNRLEKIPSISFGVYKVKLG